MILAPLPFLTVTVEAQRDRPEIHIHPGGQGVWAARMASLLGARVELCAALGGESGRLLGPLLDHSGVALRAVELESAANAAFVHDRREGERHPIAEEPEPRPTRHEIDSLYTAALASGLAADAALLTGTVDLSIINGGFYRRLVHDLNAGGTVVVADLIGEQLRGALLSGVHVIKIAAKRLVQDGYAPGSTPQELMEGVNALHDAGAQNVVVSRGASPAVGLIEDQPIEAAGPSFEVVDSHGTGDSQSAGMTVALACGNSMRDAVKLGVAAGALNVTRRGLGSGDRQAIEEHAGRIEIRPWQPPSRNG